MHIKLLGIHCVIWLVVNRLNPFIFLKRPIDGDLTWRLDQILKQKAVSICDQIWEKPPLMHVYKCLEMHNLIIQ